MLALFVVVAIAVVGGVAVLVARDRPLIVDDPVGARALAWSPEQGVGPRDLAEVRFAVALRGYRMEEVDRVLDDTRAALEDRDARIAELQRVVTLLGGASAVLKGDSLIPDPASPATDDLGSVTSAPPGIEAPGSAVPATEAWTTAAAPGGQP